VEFTIKIDDTSPIIDSFLRIHKSAWRDFLEEHDIERGTEDDKVDAALKAKFIEERVWAFIQDVLEQHLVHDVIDNAQNTAREQAKIEIGNAKKQSELKTEGIEEKGEK